MLNVHLQSFRVVLDALSSPQCANVLDFVLALRAAKARASKLLNFGESFITEWAESAKYEAAQARLHIRASLGIVLSAR